MEPFNLWETKFSRFKDYGSFKLLSCLTLLLLPIYVLRYKTRKRSKSKIESDLSTKVVVITGAANGIGEQLAYNFAKLGAQLMLADIDATKLEKVREMCISRGCATVKVFTENLCDRKSCIEFIKVVTNTSDKIDHLILNHATFQPLVPWERLMDYTLLDTMFKCNVLSYIHLVTESLPLLEKTSGNVVIMSSLVGKVPHPYLAIYASTKYALDGFFGSLKRELSLQGTSVSITFIYLGSIATPNALKSLSTFNGGALNKIVRFCEVDITCEDIMVPILEKWDVCYYPFWTVTLTIFFNRCFPWLENYFTKKVFSVKL